MSVLLYIIVLVVGAYRVAHDILYFIIQFTTGVKYIITHFATAVASWEVRGD